MENSGMQNCPQCGNPSEALVSIDTGMRFALRATGQADDLPAAVCANCHRSLAGSVSQGFKIRVEREARDKNRVMMWKNRVSLVKQARTLMENKSYSEAAVAYEKYIRVLEVVNNLERGKLDPAVFSNSERSKEMTVVASAYWDLLRIYDSNPGYGDRMSRAAENLAKFLPFSPLYPDVIRKAESFARTAKNPQIVRQFLKATKSGRGPCFIASAVFENEPYAWEMTALRRFRDDVLRTTPWGRTFIVLYYRYSPALANRIHGSQWKKRLLKPLIRKIAKLAKKSLNSTP
jgi:hypothetical protein